MDVGSVVVGFAVGWGVQALIDVAVYRGSPTYAKALEKAQGRIDALQAELAEAKRRPSDPPEPDLRPDAGSLAHPLLAPPSPAPPSPAPPLRLVTSGDDEPKGERADGTELVGEPGGEGPDASALPPVASGREPSPTPFEGEIALHRGRITELEANLEALTEENAEAARRQSLLESRLMDVESELASYRLGISPVATPLATPPVVAGAERSA